ncbi:DUF2726 domain-containing protein [Orenia marismortui]|uniref:Uncharacterized protein DUF2726 n=1 Tax=Orenia marismortui TaxID=46469 RepID=A0A4R8GTZ7_9FIRM|nr:DUF2726 domain-containing protein [Orenia marismortui]TDX48334.1 uncharacterized protein DUF2726 [Orenia marismortui]
MITKEELERLYWDEGNSMNDIGKLLNKSCSAIRYWMNKYNISRRNAADYHRKSNDEFVKDIKKLVGNKYVFLEKYKGSYTKILCKHIKCGYEWKIRPNSFLNSHNRCPKCSTKSAALKHKKTDQEFKQEVFELVGSEYSFLEKYKKGTRKIKIKHNKCGNIYYVRPHDFLSGNRCPECSLKKTIKKLRKSNNQFKIEVRELVGDEYTVLGKYINYGTKIKIRHNNCGNVYDVTPRSFVYHGNRCPYCKNSTGEEKIKQFLENNAFLFEKEYVFKDCISQKGGTLRFDFAIFNSKNEVIQIIEYDGEQHYRPIDFFGGKEGFKGVKKRDKIKNKYCKDNNIPLLRIPYWDFDNIEQILKSKLIF